MIEGDDTSVKRDPNVCVFCSHNKLTHERCIALREKHTQHSHKEVSKFGQFVRLPESDSEWRNCIVYKFDEKTRRRLKASSHYRIAAHHFLSCCIDPDKASHFLKKFVTNDNVKSLPKYERDFIGRYRTNSNNYVTNQNRPHGLKLVNLWYSIPDISVEQAEIRYSALDGKFTAVLEAEKYERKRKRQRETDASEHTTIL